MVLDKKRDSVDPLLSIVAKRFSKINPNILTWIALIFAFLSGLFFYFSSPEYELINYYLFFAALFVFLASARCNFVVHRWQMTFMTPRHRAPAETPVGAKEPTIHVAQAGARGLGKPSPGAGSGR